jgi:beta-glucanase (GH16 family)
VDDRVGSAGSVGFQVYTGGTRVYSSGRLTGASANRSVSVAVIPSSTLRLVVSDAGDRNANDMADWADARLTCSAAASAPTTPPAPTSAPAPTAPAPTAAPAPTTTPAPTTAPAPAPTVGPGDGPVSSDPSRPLGVAGAWSPLFDDEFDGASLDRTKWNDHEAWESGGFKADSAWNPVPSTDGQTAVSGGSLTMKARRATGLPTGSTFTSAHLNTRGKFAIPQGATSYTEARLKVPSGRALLPQLWLLGNGDNSTGEGWPINGEVDILEMANNKYEAGSPYYSLWYPKDVYTNAPGTWLNGTHDTSSDSFAKRPALFDSWHTWGLYRSPQRMDVYVDGVRAFTFFPGTPYMNGMPLPSMLFTNSMHVRLSLGVGGGWAGQGYTEPEYQEGDYGVAYVKVWKAA